MLQVAEYLMPKKKIHLPTTYSFSFYAQLLGHALENRLFDKKILSFENHVIQTNNPVL